MYFTSFKSIPPILRHILHLTFFAIGIALKCIDTIIIMYLNVSTIICSCFELENISVWFSLHVIKHSC